MSSLKKIVDNYMHKVSGLREHCDRCLRTERWGGSVVLMVVDAAFTSIGLNYFTAVVPKVEELSKKFVKTKKIRNLKDIAKTDINELRKVWKNKRSWISSKVLTAKGYMYLMIVISFLLMENRLQTGDMPVNTFL